VDRAGYDYLRRMCHASRYLVIEETCELPRELPKIYRKLTT
jgi:nitric oxide reductase activation protein